ncbi:MAG: hypothetical protein ACRYF5_04160, partial [Janthinobacterium lividum]
MKKQDEHRQQRRLTLGLLAAGAATAATVASGLPLAAAAPVVKAADNAAERAAGIRPGALRIGYQKYGTLIILKGRGTLEKRLAEHGVEVKWTEFTAGPVLLEGLNVGSIDFGTTGEAPPIFAQAAGADL